MTILAAILFAALESVDIPLFTQLPGWAADVTAVPTNHLAWGNDGRGEIVRNNVTNYVGVCSCVDGYYERRLIGVDCLDPRDYRRPYMTWTNRTETATNEVTTFLYETPIAEWPTARLIVSPPVGINTSWDNGAARKFDNSQRLASLGDILQVRDGLTGNPHLWRDEAVGLTVPFCGRVLREVAYDLDPPLGAYYSGDVYFRRIRSNPGDLGLEPYDWIRVFPTYGRLSNDPYVWPHVSAYRNYEHCSYLRAHPWLSTNLVELITNATGYVRHHPAPVNLVDVVYAAQTGSATNLLAAYTNDTRRLLWPRSGCIDVIEGAMTETYRARSLLAERIESHAAVTFDRSGSVTYQIDWDNLDAIATNLCFDTWGGASTNGWSSFDRSTYPISFMAHGNTGAVSRVESASVVTNLHVADFLLGDFLASLTAVGYDPPPAWPQAWRDEIGAAEWSWGEAGGHRTCYAFVKGEHLACAMDGTIEVTITAWRINPDDDWTPFAAPCRCSLQVRPSGTAEYSGTLLGTVRKSAVSVFSHHVPGHGADNVMSNLYALGFAVSNVTDSVGYGIGGADTYLDIAAQIAIVPNGPHTYTWYEENRPELIPTYQALWRPLGRIRAASYAEYEANCESILSETIRQVGQSFELQTGRTRWAESWIVRSVGDLIESPASLAATVGAKFQHLQLGHETDNYWLDVAVVLEEYHNYSPVSHGFYVYYNAACLMLNDEPQEWDSTPYLPLHVQWTAKCYDERSYETFAAPEHETWADLYEQTRTAFRWHNIRPPQ